VQPRVLSPACYGLPALKRPPSVAPIR
jgi:hypothetical protein